MYKKSVENPRYVKDISEIFQPKRLIRLQKQGNNNKITFKMHDNRIKCFIFASRKNQNL